MSTATATTSLTLATQKPFGELTCDFYKNNSGEFYMTREQVGQALEYDEPRKKIAVIHTRNKDRLDPLSTRFQIETPSRGPQEMVLYNLRGVMEICRLSRQPKADKFMDFVWDVMESLYNGNSVLAAPDQQTAVMPETFKTMVDSFVKTQESTNILIQSFIEDQKNSRAAMSSMVNTISLLVNRVLDDKKAVPVKQASTDNDDLGITEEDIKSTKSAKDKIPYVKPIKHRRTTSEWKGEIADKIKQIMANQPGRFQASADIVNYVYDKMHDVYGFSKDQCRKDYYHSHPQLGGNFSTMTAVEANAQWHEVFDSILEDLLDDSIKRCVKGNPKVKYDKNGLAEFDANSFGNEAREQEAPAKPKIKWLRSTTANPNNGSRIDAAVKSVVDATNDRTAHSAASYHLIYDEMKPNWPALFTAFQEKFGVKANLRRELFVNSDSLTDRFVFAADAVVTKHSKKEES